MNFEPTPPLAEAADSARTQLLVLPFQPAGIAGFPSRQIVMAVDTQADQLRTLTIQVAARVGNGIAIQMYIDDELPRIEPSQIESAIDPTVRNRAGSIIVRPIRLITPDLSPSQMIADVFDRPDVKPQQPSSATSPDLPVLDLTMITHGLRTHMLRRFGSRWLSALLSQDGGVVITGRNGRDVFASRSGWGNPIVEFARTSYGNIRIRLTDHDLQTMHSKQRLQSLANSLIQTDIRTPACIDPACMYKSFRTTPIECLVHAAQNALTILLSYEQTITNEGQVFRALGLTSPTNIRGTAGARAGALLSEFKSAHVRGSNVLNTRTKLNTHAKLAGARAITEMSRFGPQTADVHGGLLHNRCPNSPMIHAPTRLRDVDLRSCYPSILGKIRLYLGRPVVWEPGANVTTLGELVRLMEITAAGHDAWFAKVSGQIRNTPNILIPSTRQAITHNNFRKRRVRRGADDRPRGSEILTDEIHAGIITRSTWLAISAMPPATRQEYENLIVETVVFHPKIATADTSEQFDEIHQRLKISGPNWYEALSSDAAELHTRTKLDQRNATLRLPLDRLIHQMQQLRTDAERSGGDSLGLAAGYKILINSMYGILGSPHTASGNVLAANIVTSTARAVAFIQHMALNGCLTSTDGCCYHIGRIPACTFAESLTARPDYPLVHAHDGIPFLPTQNIPLDDAEFTTWYRTHAQRFLNVSGPEWDQLLSIHTHAHKTGPGNSRAFDTLITIGAGDHLKSSGYGETLTIESKLRGWDRHSRQQLELWIHNALAHHYLPPLITSSTSSMGADAAAHAARRAQRSGSQLTLLPLGADAMTARLFRIIRPSAFTYRTAVQRRAWHRAFQKLIDIDPTGFDTIATRRSYDGSITGSLQQVAVRIHDLIRASNKTPARSFNLHRIPIDTQSLTDAKKALHRQFSAFITLNSPPTTGLAIPSGHPIPIDRKPR